MKSKKFHDRRFIFAVLLTLVVAPMVAGCTNFYNDILDKKKILLLFNSLYNRSGLVQKNAIGPTTSTILRTLDFTPSNINSVFVAKTGGDLTGNGTMEQPYLTITKAITACDVNRQAIVILDSGTYEEKGFAMVGNFKGLYAGLGFQPIIRVLKNNSYFYISEIKHETFITALGHSNQSTTILNDGNVFIVYRDDLDGLKAKYQIIDPDGWTIVVNETALPIPPVLCTASATLQNGNVVIAYDSYAGSSAKFIVIDPGDGHIVKTETSLSTCTTGPLAVLVLANGCIVAAYCDYTNSPNYQVKYVVLDPVTWSIIKTESQISSTSAWFVSATLTKNNNVLFFYGASSTTTKGRIKVYNPNDNWNVVLPETPITAGATIYCTAATTLKSGDILLSYNINNNGPNSGGYIVIDQDNYSIIMPETTFNTQNTFHVASSLMNDGTVFLAYAGGQSGSESIIRYINLAPKVLQHILVSSDAVFNGINFIPDSSVSADSFIRSPLSVINVRWCDFSDNMSSVSGVATEVVTSSGETSIRNCRFTNNADVLHVSNSKVTVADSQFYKNSGLAIRINGSAALPGDIAVDHCDFFNNARGGLILDGNSGINEMIKNSIFHDNGGCGINVVTAVKILNSVVTDTVKNAAMNRCTTSDPLYLNEGTSESDNTDLNLQSLVMGYPEDSSAIGLSDDGRNAGAYDVEY